MIPRRRFLQGGIALAGLVLAGGCSRLRGSRQPARVARIGVLSAFPASAPAAVRYREAFLDGLRELGYENGRSVVIEFRYSEGRLERASEQAAEMVRMAADVIVLSGDLSMAAARQATTTTPIVFALNSAPIETGIVASLARPGGNITGLSEMTPELSGKRLELLRDAVPGLARPGVIWSPHLPGPVRQYEELEAAADAIGVDLLPLPVRAPEDFEPAFDAAARSGADALVVLTGSVTNPNASRIVELVAQNRLPAIYGERLWVDAGGLMSYGANVADMWRRAAGYVDKILRGTDPADLPVERPDTFDLVVNLVTARALGFTFPQSILQQATEFLQ